MKQMQTQQSPARYIVRRRESQSARYFWTPREAMAYFRGCSGTVDLLLEDTLLMSKAAGL